MRFAIHILCIVIALASCARSSLGQCDPSWLPGNGFVGFNNTVNCLTSWTPPVPGASPELVAVGKYSVAGSIATNGIASWNSTSWSAIGSLPLLDMTAATVVNGVLYVSTGYTIWKFDGANWQSIGVASAGAVRSMIEWNGSLVVAGEFSSFAGILNTRVAMWNGTNWTGLSGMSSGGVQALAVFNGELYAGGNFFTAGPVVSALARWDGSAWKRLQTNNFTGQVQALLATPTELIVGGFFNVPGNTSSKNISAWNGTAWTSYDLGINSRVYSLALFRGSLVATTQSPALAIMTWNGSSWSKISPDNISGITSSLAFNDRFYVAGTFSNIGTTRAECIAEWDGTRWTGLGIGGLDDAPNCFVKFENRIIAGGPMKFVGETPTGGLAQWDGVSWQPFPSNFLTVTSLCVHNNILYAAATTTDGQHLCHWWNGTQWIAIPGNFIRAASAQTVYAITFYRDRLIVAGNFNFVGSTPVNNIAEWTGEMWRPLGDGVKGGADSCGIRWVETLLVRDDVLCVGGAFEVAGEVPVNSAAQWNGISWSSLAGGFTNPPVCGSLVCEFAEFDGSLIAGGSFSTSGAQMNLRNLARLSENSWTKFSPDPIKNTRISSFTTLNGSLFVGGSYSSPSNFPFAKWNGDSWTYFPDQLTSAVDSMITFGNEILVSGSFTLVDGKVSAYLARYSDTSVPWTARQPASIESNINATISLSSTPASGYSDVSFHWQRNGIDITDGPAGASPNGGNVTGSSGILNSPTTDMPAALIIANAQSSDSGQYTVVFSNSCGESTSNLASVVIHAACPADFNHDGFVDDTDFSIFVVAYNILDCADPAMPANCPSDLNADQIVDDADFTLFLPAYNAMLCP